MPRLADAFQRFADALADILGQLAKRRDQLAVIGRGNAKGREFAAIECGHQARRHDIARSDAIDGAIEQAFAPSRVATSRAVHTSSTHRQASA
jgi:hypothetical protein